jgi:hypothetical protein
MSRGAHQVEEIIPIYRVRGSMAQAHVIKRRTLAEMQELVGCRVGLRDGNIFLFQRLILL